MSQQTRVAALKMASAIVVGFGLLMFAALFAPLRPVLAFFLDLAFFDFAGTGWPMAPEGRLFLAIAGGLLAGWGLMLWLLTSRIYAAQPELGGPIILAGIAVWYVVDSLGSIIVGAWFNAVLNLAFVALFAVPVLYRRPSLGVSTA